MFREEYIRLLLVDLYEKDTINVYDHSAEIFNPGSEEFGNTKCFADQLVRDKLAKYNNEDHSGLHITNYGRYWMMKGGYKAFLKESQEKQKEKNSSMDKEKLLEARLRLTHYRLLGFWLALIISCVGFALSLFNLYLLLKGKK
jgi:hypothetical protein